MAEMHICDFCGKSMDNRTNQFMDYEYKVLGAGIPNSPEFCSKKCLVAYLCGYKPADTKVEAKILVPAGKVPLCPCWWCRLTRWFGFKAERD